MAVDLSQLNLNEPEKMDWDNYHEGSSYRRPPVPIGPDGKARVFYAKVPNQISFGNTKAGDLTIEIGTNRDLPGMTIVKSGNGADGYELRNTRASVKKWTNKKTGEPMNVSQAGNFLKAAGVQAKPQTPQEYAAAALATRGKVVALTTDWQAYDKSTGESIEGYSNFPDDPERPGEKKAIVNKGDTYIDKDGVTRTAQAEVMFANGRVRFFQVPK